MQLEMVRLFPDGSQEYFAPFNIQFTCYLVKVRLSYKPPPSCKAIQVAVRFSGLPLSPTV